MARPISMRVFESALIGLSVVWASPSPAWSQIIPDGSLGAEGSVVAPGSVNGLPVELIQGGASRGSNLFHSFSEFNVNTGQAVYFANPTGITNILSRITGSSVSDIDGLLGVAGNANLFLLNPNGIVFGPNAQLDLRGAFTASTGDVGFGDGSQFGATSPTDTSLLSVNVPLGVQFGDAHSGTIDNAGNLAVDAGQSLTLLGETVLNSGSLTAPGGTVQLLGDYVGLTDQGQVDVSAPNGGGTVLVGGDYQGQGTIPHALQTYVGPDTTITASAQSSGDGGQIVVWSDQQTTFGGTIAARGGPEGGNGGLVEVSSQGNLQFAGTVDTLAPQGQPGTLLLDPLNILITSDIVNATDFVANSAIIPATDLVFSDFIYSVDENLATGETSVIDPTTIETLILSNDLTLEAQENITVIDPVSISGNSLTLRTTSPTSTIVFAPDLLSNVDGVTVIGGGNGDTILSQSGQGTVTLEVGNGILLQEGSGINSFGGDISLTAGSSINLINNAGTVATLSTSVNSPVDTGNITLAAPTISIISINDSYTTETISSSVSPDPNGLSTGLLTGGDITITADILDMTDSFIYALTDGQGDSGAVQINASSAVNLSNSSIWNTVYFNSSAGNSGGISINTGSLSLNNFSDISTYTYGQGNAGPIQIDAYSDVIVTGSSAIASGVYAGAVGNGGNIALSASSLNLSGNSSISASSDGQGNSGLIQLDIASSTTVDNSGITSQIESAAVGTSGGISIDTGSLSVTNGSAISASTFGQGDSGLIQIDANSITLDTGSNLTFGTGIYSEVVSGATGNSSGIDITTGSLDVQNGAQISARTLGQGNSGPVAIQANTVNLDGTNSTIVSDVYFGAVGNSNGLSINTNTLDVLNGANIFAGTAGQGNAGPIQINATGAVTVSGSGSTISTEVNAPASGSGNSINLTAGNLTIDNGGAIITTAFQGSNAGNITIDTGAFQLTNGTIMASSQAGSGGNVSLISRSTTADSFGLNNGQITTQALSGSGQSGNVSLTAAAPVLNFQNGSLISTEGFDLARAGAINIIAPNSILMANDLGNNDILATATSGNNGLITINALSVRGFAPTEVPNTNNQLRLNTTNDISPLAPVTGGSNTGGSHTGGSNTGGSNTGGSVISTSPTKDAANAVTSSSSDSNPTQEEGALELPVFRDSSTIFQAPGLLAARCGNQGTNQNQFVVTGSGGFPSSPNDSAMPTLPAVPWVTATTPAAGSPTASVPPAAISDPVAAATPPTNLVEAKSWLVDANGQVYFVANQSFSNASGEVEIPATLCNRIQERE